MAFTVEQGGQRSELNPLKKSFTTDQVWLSEPTLNKDVTAQDGCVLSAALESSVKIADSLPFSPGISFEQMLQSTYPGRVVASGEVTPGVAPCTPCPSFLQQKSQGQRTTKLSLALPSLCLGIHLSESQQVQCMQRRVDSEIPNSPDKILHQLSTYSPRSLVNTPTHGCEFPLDVQRDGYEPYKEDTMSSMLCKHEKHLQEWEGPHAALSLGHFTETLGLQKSPASSRDFKLSFLENLTSGGPHYTQDTDFAQYIEGELDSKLPLSEAEGCSQHFSECLNRFEPGLVSPPPVKQDWNKSLTLTRCNPAFSGRQSVAISALRERESPEKRSKLLLSQRSLAFGGSDEWNEFNVSSSGATYRDEARQKAENFEKHNAMASFQEASDLKTKWRGQPLENSFRPVNLAKVKVEIGYEESNGRQYTCREGVEENDKSVGFKMKPHTEVGYLESCCPTHAPRCSSSGVLDVAAEDLQLAGPKLLRTSVCAQMPQVLSTVSAGGPSICFRNEQSQKPMDLDEQTTPMSRTSQIDGGWGKFLALSATAVGDTIEADTEIILPFQRRFKKLQEFLKQCDTSDKYSLQAFQSLSAATRNCHAVDLETRAVRLSFEEGKELKRMKLLNVLGKASGGPYVGSSGTYYGPRVPTPGAIVQVKQES